MLGQSVQLGAGWGMKARHCLSRTVTMRVVPWAGDERITYAPNPRRRRNPDTNSCAQADATQRAKDCHWRDAVPASRIVARSATADCRSALHTRTGQRAGLRRGREHLLEISAFSAAVHSTPLQALALDPRDPLRTLERHEDDSTGCRLASDQRDNARATDEQAQQSGAGRCSRRAAQEGREHELCVRQTRALSVCLLAFAGIMRRIASPARAEPVEIHQADHVGSGNSFRRGATCLVLTAHHVVPETGVPITVFDRSGAKAEGTRSYDNAAYDLALIALPDNPPSPARRPGLTQPGWLARELHAKE